MLLAKENNHFEKCFVDLPFVCVRARARAHTCVCVREREREYRMIKLALVVNDYCRFV